MRSIIDTIYSYTVQLIISISWNLVGPLFLCLKEASGRLDDTVKKNLFAPSNILLTCSKWAKLTSSLIEYWRDNVLAPEVSTGGHVFEACRPVHVFEGNKIMLKEWKP